ncbi:MAG: hypothetical protein D6753_15340 [Planctomycetota bacterium]|nr:MAG: hypothetical protein D6753_15340 [Planctomycetota bacterium]
MQKIRVAISTCPNDTFAFHGLLTGRVEIPGVEPEFELLDIEQLNAGMLGGRFDAAKVSFAAALEMADRVWVLPSGSALGFGVGPLLLSAKEGDVPSTADRLILCPGEHTTANLLFRLFYPQCTRVEQVVFSEIMPRLRSGAADFGVCIHEGRFTWREQGVHCVEDLGQRWEQTTDTPLPLGGIVVRRDVPTDVALALQTALRRSLQLALADPDAALPTMRRYAQEFDDRVLMQHVELYVNVWTLDLGQEGHAALQQLGRLYRTATGRSVGALEVLPSPD